MNIEEIFKSSLENSEMPFDPKAWEAMSSRLDQAMPASTPKPSYKWAWVASVSLIVGVAAFFTFNGKTEKITVKDQPTPILSEENRSQNTPAIADQNTVKSTTIAATEEKKPESSKKTIGFRDVACSGAPAGEIGEGFGASQITKSSGSGDVKQFRFIAPIVNDKYCESEKIVLKNPNDYAIRLISDNGNYLIEANKTLSLELSEAGEYYFLYYKNTKLEKESAFKVQSKPRADFYADDETLYEDGLPVNKLQALSSAKEYTWMNSKGDVLSREKDFKVHLFTKGQHEITLKIENANGCSSEVTKPVRCEVNYNLLAVNGFDPTSTDNRNNTFIPYALLEKQRNVPFEMEIIDPKTGQTIFRTKNANEPWDGIDSRTNQLVAPGSTYIWKVKLYEKDPSEPGSSYKGTITRI